MPILKKQDLIKCPPPVGRLLCMDLGTKTIGLALSSPDHMLSMPYQTMRRIKFSVDADHLSKLKREYDIKGYVLGWPLNMDDSEGPACDRVRSFADEMTQYPGIFGENPWILLWDERLSTAAVRALVDKPVDKKMKDRGEVDALAAHIILQGALDHLARI